jgi:hypothetical protein
VAALDALRALGEAYANDVSWIEYVFKRGSGTDIDSYLGQALARVNHELRTGRSDFRPTDGPSRPPRGARRELLIRARDALGALWAVR